MLVNDDSIHAEGIKVLEEVVTAITPHVWVIAPAQQMSATGHSLTIHTPLRIKEYDKRHYAVYGTPTDCVLMGVQKIMDDFKPDVIISGINHGQNTADDMTYSGTIAAAMEAALMGIPAIACSQDYEEHGGRPDWQIARKYLPMLLKKLEGYELDSNTVFNVNFPMPRPGVTPEIRAVSQGHYSARDQKPIKCTDPRGNDYYWIGPPGGRDILDQTKDMGALAGGHVTITPLTLNMTHHPVLKTLEGMFP
jgi:5'-nucleotidase